VEMAEKKRAKGFKHKIIEEEEEYKVV